MKRLIFALSLTVLIGLFAVSWPGANAYALNSSSGQVLLAQPSAYQTVQYYYYTPYYDYYGPSYGYYNGPGFYINTPFFGFSFP